jgi:pimeloyl-ACP methyl ester carboxylesterase
MTMIEKSFLGLSATGFHRVAYSEWGKPDAGQTVLCVHGLARNAGDFDYLAEALSDRARVVCVDVVGRGRSDWLASPALYGYPQYLADLTALIARLDVSEVLWVGTSMGGLLGMMMAAQPRSPVKRLVMNDVGPFVPGVALERIAGYVGSDPVFEDMAALEAYLRFIYQGFGRLPDDRWANMAEHSARLRPDGRFGLAYDPGIGNALKAGPIKDVDLWTVWEAVRCPAMVLRGANSDVLPREVAEAMTQRGPMAELLEVPGTAHAPSLMVEEQIQAVRQFLFAG